MQQIHHSYYCEIIQKRHWGVFGNDDFIYFFFFLEFESFN